MKFTSGWGIKTLNDHLLEKTSDSRLAMAWLTPLPAGKICSIQVTGASFDAPWHARTLTLMARLNYFSPDTSFKRHLVVKAGDVISFYHLKISNHGTMIQIAVNGNENFKGYYSSFGDKLQFSVDLRDYVQRLEIVEFFPNFIFPNLCLMEMAAHVVLSNMNRNKVSNLPLPERIKTFLLESSVRGLFNHPSEFCPNKDEDFVNTDFLVTRAVVDKCKTTARQREKVYLEDQICRMYPNGALTDRADMSHLFHMVHPSARGDLSNPNNVESLNKRIRQLSAFVQYDKYLPGHCFPASPPDHLIP